MAEQEDRGGGDPVPVVIQGEEDFRIILLHWFESYGKIKLKIGKEEVEVTPI